MSTSEHLYTVGEVSQLLRISVRTLHYWEERGLIMPQARSWSDYRLYSQADIQRLQQILIYRATGMSLGELKKLLETADSALEHLQRQKEMLMQKRSTLENMLEAVDKLIEDTMSNRKLNVEEISELLGEANFASYQAEEEAEWGETDDWQISQERQATMTAQDWQNMKMNMESLEVALAQAMQQGVKPGSAKANELAQAHREAISTFFPVTHSKQVVIARGYVADPRFRAHYEKRAAGLAKWLQEIINANAQLNGVDPQTADWE